MVRNPHAPVLRSLARHPRLLGALVTVILLLVQFGLGAAESPNTTTTRGP